MSPKQISAQQLSQMAITDVIPHRDPMILINRLISYKTDTLLTQVDIDELSPYFDAEINGVPNYVSIEYMAQSIAALAGLEAKSRGDNIRVGFLLGTRKLQMHISGYQLGESYQTQVNRLYQEESGLAVFDCQIFHQQTLVATANVNVFQPNDIKSYLSKSKQEDPK
ncbi:MAG: hotdog family protein [Shewanella sp.]